MAIKSIIGALCLFSLASTTIQAASIYLTPSAGTVDIADGTTTLDIFMDFTGDPTVGGGIDFNVSGMFSFVSFAPSAYLSGLNTAPDDSDFTGYGTTDADNDFEIHYGSFAGESGINQLGSLTLSLDGLGIGNVDIAINSLWGDFYSATTFDMQTVNLSGASLEVTAVPIPAAIWMFISGLGVLGYRVRK